MSGRKVSGGHVPRGEVAGREPRCGHVVLTGHGPRQGVSRPVLKLARARYPRGEALHGPPAPPPSARGQQGRPQGGRRVVSVAAPSGPAHLALADTLRGRGHPGRAALEQLVPVLLAHERAAQEVVAVARHELRPALGAREALEVEHVQWCGGRGCAAADRGACVAADTHHELAGWDGLPARRARARVAE